MYRSSPLSWSSLRRSLSHSLRHASHRLRRHTSQIAAANHQAERHRYQPVHHQEEQGQEGYSSASSNASTRRQQMRGGGQHRRQGSDSLNPHSLPPDEDEEDLQLVEEPRRQRSIWSCCSRLYASLRKQPTFRERTIYFNGGCSDSTSPPPSSSIGASGATLDPPLSSFPPNVVRNQKYHVLTFLPHFLYEQFSFFFNFYFLLVALTQFVPPLQIGFLFTYVAPLAFVLAVTMSKEALDDLQRWRRDREANSEIYQRLRARRSEDGLHLVVPRSDGSIGNSEAVLESIPASAIKVGDILQLHTDQRVPADLLLLRTHDRANGSIFIRTDQLDGETDWKLRNAIRSTQGLMEDQDLLKIRAQVNIEPPRKEIYEFVANFRAEGAGEGGGEGGGSMMAAGAEATPSATSPSSASSSSSNSSSSSSCTEPLSLDHTLWSNTVVASGTVYGLVIYTGRETRSVMNANQPTTKTGLLDQELNALSKVLFGLSFVLALVLSSLKGMDGGRIGVEDQVDGGGLLGTAGLQLWVVTLVRFVLLFSSIIPISMRVNLDMSKALYAFLIHRDPAIPGAIVRNSTIPEELGRISYLFMDKTGTLTQNIMQFKCLQLEPPHLYTKNHLPVVRAALENSYARDREVRRRNDPNYGASSLSSTTGAVMVASSDDLVDNSNSSSRPTTTVRNIKVAPIAPPSPPSRLHSDAPVLTPSNSSSNLLPHRSSYDHALSDEVDLDDSELNVSSTSTSPLRRPWSRGGGGRGGGRHPTHQALSMDDGGSSESELSLSRTEENGFMAATSSSSAQTFKKRGGGGTYTQLHRRSGGGGGVGGAQPEQEEDDADPDLQEIEMGNLAIANAKQHPPANNASGKRGMMSPLSYSSASSSTSLPSSPAIHGDELHPYPSSSFPSAVRPPSSSSSSSHPHPPPSPKVESLIRHMVTALALCHNVTPVYEEGSHGLDSTPTYQASSPDEVALVKFTESVGLKLIKRTQQLITLQTPLANLDARNGVGANDPSHIEEYEILQIFPFTSESKRMGIIVRPRLSSPLPPGSPAPPLTFYLKGADTIMKSRILHSEWLEEEVDNLARVGLRTLVIAQRQLTEGEYMDFLRKYTHAQSIMGPDRDSAIQSALSSLERNLTLLGLTGVEDRLQEGVKSTLETLRHAGLNLWMLTGDNAITARCVGVSARLVERGQNVYSIVGCSNMRDTARMLDAFSTKHNTVLIIDGPSLQICLDSFQKLFLELACAAPSVICCRCSPTQKATVVSLMRAHTGKRTAAIGDGGNDCSMILAADVGVGIVGKEGKQASLAADFSLNQFSHLGPLLLWHGRNSYKRSARLSQFVMHRGLIICMIQAVFSALFFFAPLALFNGWLMVGYATFYTMLPVFSLVLDEDVSERTVFLYPELYKELTKGRPLSYKTFFIWVFWSVYQGGVIMILSILLFEARFLDIVSITFTALIASELLNVALEVHKWHRLMIGAQVASVLVYFISLLLLPSYFDITFIFTWGFLWKVALITSVSCLPPALAKYLHAKYSPSAQSKINQS